MKTILFGKINMKFIPYFLFAAYETEIQFVTALPPSTKVVNQRKVNVKSLKLALCGVVALCTVGYVQASFACGYESYNDPTCFGVWEKQREQAENQNSTDQAATQAEAQRQWQIREDAVQARIAKYRATPAYGAIAVSSMDSSTGWGGGYKTLAESTQVALRACTGSCQIIASFFNTCAGVASLKNSKDPKAVVVATDPDKETALNKALAQCENKFGKGNCGMRNNDVPLCSGYDYGVFPK